jgi:hypothetical protein
LLYLHHSLLHWQSVQQWENDTRHQRDGDKAFPPGNYLGDIGEDRRCNGMYPGIEL